MNTEILMAAFVVMFIGFSASIAILNHKVNKIDKWAISTIRKVCPHSDYEYEFWGFILDVEVHYKRCTSCGKYEKVTKEEYNAAIREIEKAEIEKQRAELKKRAKAVRDAEKGE